MPMKSYVLLNEIVGDILQKIRESFDKKIEELKRKRQKITDLKLHHAKEIVEELGKAFYEDYQNYLKGNMKQLKLVNYDFIVKNFIEPHVKWMYKVMKESYSNGTGGEEH